MQSFTQLAQESPILSWVLNRDKDLWEIFGEYRCKKFVSEVEAYEKKFQEAINNPLIHHMNAKEKQEFINLSAPHPVF